MHAAFFGSLFEPKGKLLALIVLLKQVFQLKTNCTSVEPRKSSSKTSSASSKLMHALIYHVYKSELETQNYAKLTLIRDRKTQPTEFNPPNFGRESEANRGWYLFSCNLLTGGIRDF